MVPGKNGSEIPSTSQFVNFALSVSKPLPSTDQFWVEEFSYVYIRILYILFKIEIIQGENKVQSKGKTEGRVHNLHQWPKSCSPMSNYAIIF